MLRRTRSSTGFLITIKPRRAMAGVVRAGASDEQVNLRRGRLVYQVGARSLANGAADRVGVDIELGAQRGEQRVDISLGDRDHDIDIERGARLPADRAGQRAADDVAQPARIQGLGDAKRDLDGLVCHVRGLEGVRRPGTGGGRARGRASAQRFAKSTRAPMHPGAAGERRRGQGSPRRSSSGRPAASSGAATSCARLRPARTRLRESCPG